jgi:hypothetical protein
MITIFALTILFDLGQWTFFAGIAICNFTIRTGNTTITIAIWNFIIGAVLALTIHCNFI